MANSKAFFVKKEVTLPMPVESVRDGVIQWGKDNIYPQYLNGLFYNCAVHSGIIRSKVHYTVSGGLNYEGSDIEKWEKFLSNGKSDFDLNELAEQASLDSELYNGICIRGLWSLDKSTIDYIEVVDFEKVRYIEGSEDIFISENWNDKREPKKRIKPFNPFDKEEREFFVIWKEKTKQFFEGRDSNSYYPAPPYSGGLTSILTDVKITKYQLNEISNGFSTGTVLNLNSGKPNNKEDQRLLEKEIKDNATGEDNAGGMLVLYSNGKDREASILNISGNDLNDRYNSLSKDVRENIVLSHSVTTPILFGIKTEGALGNATELEVGYNIMNANYFEYRRRAIYSILEYLFKKGCNGTGTIRFNDVKLNVIKEVEEVEEVEQFKKQEFKGEDVFKMFEECGVERSTFKTILKKQLPNEFDVSQESENFINEFKKNEFRDLTKIESNIVKLVNDGESFNSILIALDLSKSRLARIYNRLIKNDVISVNGGLTENGLKELGKSQPDRIEVFYSYDLRADITGSSVIPTTRDFCREMVRLSQTRVWSRQDIDRISGVLGYNVFSYRGGWYHNPNTDKNTPWCRHVWNQELIFR